MSIIKKKTYIIICILTFLINRIFYRFLVHNITSKVMSLNISHINNTIMIHLLKNFKYSLQVPHADTL